jgi:hypothetical protein
MQHPTEEQDPTGTSQTKQGSAVPASLPQKFLLGFFLFHATFISEDFVQMKLNPLNHLVGENFLGVSAGLPLLAAAISYFIFWRRNTCAPDEPSRLREAWYIAKRVFGTWALFVALFGAVALTESHLVQSVDVPAFMNRTADWRAVEQQLGFRISIQYEPRNIERIFFFRSPGRSEKVAALAAAMPQPRVKAQPGSVVNP